MHALINQFQAQRWLYLFIFLHLLLWTIVPWFIRFNLPMDAIEGTVWGHQLEWGYDKNPFLNGWLTALATYLDGQSGFLVYFFSQVSVAICFWATWQLAILMLPAAYALIAVMLLEGVQYYNFHAIDFNDNNLELSLWALTTYFFYRALRSPTYLTWMLTGLFAGLGMMAKYYTAVLLASMALFLFINTHNRQQLKTLRPYVGLALFLLVILPHIIWLFFHDFITISYVFERTDIKPNLANHALIPATFTFRQFQTFFPAILLTLFLFIGKERAEIKESILAPFDQAFLCYVGFGPFLLTITLSLLFGIRLINGWGMPLLTLWGIILLGILRPPLSTLKLYSFCAGIFTLMLALVSGYSFSLINSFNVSSANYPGPEIARFITERWHNIFQTKLAYVAGSRWIGGNVEFYSHDHPTVFINWEKSRSPWIDEKDMVRKGAVFIWDDDNESLPLKIQQQFPQLQRTTILEFSWHRNKHHLEPIRIGVAMLPPNPDDLKEYFNNARSRQCN